MGTWRNVEKSSKCFASVGDRVAPVTGKVDRVRNSSQARPTLLIEWKSGSDSFRRRSTAMRFDRIRLFLVACLMVLATSAFASDGVLEINQTCALQTGCMSGDTAGFPVTITTSGSYVLTSDLDVPPNVVAIDLRAEGLAIDLNGFTIRSTYLCEPGDCPSIGAGNGINRNFGDLSWGRRVTVKNGSVIGFNGLGLRLAEEAHVEGVAVRHVGGAAIQVGAGSVVLANRVSNGRVRGLDLGEGTVYAHNTVQLVGLGSGPSFDEAIHGGTETGGNYCDHGTCSTLRAGPIRIVSGQFLSCMRWNIGDTSLSVTTTLVAGSNTGSGTGLTSPGTSGSSSIGHSGILNTGYCVFEVDGDRSNLRASACVHQSDGPCLVTLQAQ
jgi:hypothetical protein